MPRYGHAITPLTAAFLLGNGRLLRLLRVVSMSDVENPRPKAALFRRRWGWTLDAVDRLFGGARDRRRRLRNGRIVRTLGRRRRLTRKDAGDLRQDAALAVQLAVRRRFRAAREILRVDHRAMFEF